MSSSPQSAAGVGISFADLLRYNESEVAKWRAWLEKQPAAVLEVPFGEAAKRMGNVREMLWHIFIVEWVYACALNGEAFGGWDKFKRESPADLFAIGDASRAGLRRYLESATPADISKTVTMSAAGMTIQGSARKFLAHTFIHSLRHWAQLATVLRQNGYVTDWQHDFVLSDGVE